MAMSLLSCLLALLPPTACLMQSGPSRLLPPPLLTLSPTLLLQRELSPSHKRPRRLAPGGMGHFSELPLDVRAEERQALAWSKAVNSARSQSGSTSIASALEAAEKGSCATAVGLGMVALAAGVEGGRLPSVRSCNQLLRELGDRGRMEEMKEFFHVMLRAGIQPTQVTYGTLISRAGASRQPLLASQCFRDMLRRELQPDAQTYNSLINAFAKSGEVSKVIGSCRTDVF